MSETKHTHGPHCGCTDARLRRIGNTGGPAGEAAAAEWERREEIRIVDASEEDARAAFARAKGE